jgi:hypothetical protein
MFKALLTYSTDIKQLLDWVFLLEGITRDKRLQLVNFFKRHYPEIPLPTIWRLREKLQALTNIEPIWYHCCPKICIAYTGSYQSLEACPKCQTSRYFPNSRKAQKRWPFFPLLPRLIRQFNGVDAEKLTTYRAKFDNVPQTAALKDVFNGRWYQELRKKGFFTR